MTLAQSLRRRWHAGSVQKDALVVLGLALLTRLGVVAYAWGRFLPADDGKYYQILAERLASGQGYTWLWPDGAVTPAAHYPVGYPALLAGAYSLLGARPEIGMLLNALLGAGGAWAVHRLSALSAPRAGALAAGLAAALHPTLVFYTAALMTEGVTAALLALFAVLALAVGKRRRWWLWVVLGVGAGALVLIRPQSLLLVPFLGALAGSPGWGRVRGALTVTALSLLTCLPWTLRNCQRMDRCVFVSDNAGWNLFIGAAPGATGSWVALEELGVPEECREVFGEAAKDECFGRAGLRHVLSDPLAYLALIPDKLRATFDGGGAAGYYLYVSNPEAFGERARRALGSIEVVFERLLLLAALIGVALPQGQRVRARRGMALLGALFLFARFAWASHLLLVGVIVLSGRVWGRPARAGALSVVLVTAVTHAIFFGADRYAMVGVPWLIAVAAEALSGGRHLGDRSPDSGPLAILV